MQFNEPFWKRGQFPQTVGLFPFWRPFWSLLYSPFLVSALLTSLNALSSPRLPLPPIFDPNRIQYRRQLTNAPFSPRRSPAQTGGNRRCRTRGRTGRARRRLIRVSRALCVSFFGRGREDGAFLAEEGVFCTRWWSLAGFARAEDVGSGSGVEDRAPFSPFSFYSPLLYRLSHETLMTRD
jgi:hypothetical protein